MYYVLKPAFAAVAAAPDISTTADNAHYKPAPRALNSLNRELLEDILITIQSETRRAKYRKEAKTAFPDVLSPRLSGDASRLLSRQRAGQGGKRPRLDPRDRRAGRGRGREGAAEGCQRADIRGEACKPPGLHIGDIARGGRGMPSHGQCAACVDGLRCTAPGARCT